MRRSDTCARAHFHDILRCIGRYPLAGLIGWYLLPSPAYAHLVNSGLGPFYDGALHLLLSPGDLLGLLAVSLLAGLAGARAGRLTVIVLPSTWLLTGLIGLQLSITLQMPWLSVAFLAVLGALVAADLKLTPWLVAALAGFYAGLQGLLNGAALLALGAGLSSLFGSSATVLVITLLGSALVISRREPWVRIVVRVAGSWVAAVGILMFGWMLKGTG